MWIRTSSMSPYWLFVFNFIALAYNFIVLVCTKSTLGHLLPVRHQPDTLQYLGVCTGTHAEETTPSPCWYVQYGRPCFFFYEHLLSLNQWTFLYVRLLYWKSQWHSKRKKKRLWNCIFLVIVLYILFDFDIEIIWTAIEVFVCLNNWYISNKSNIDWLLNITLVCTGWH